MKNVFIWNKKQMCETRNLSIYMWDCPGLFFQFKQGNTGLLLQNSFFYMMIWVETWRIAQVTHQVIYSDIESKVTLSNKKISSKKLI